MTILSRASIRAATNSAHRAGWPTPEEFVADLAIMEDEDEVDYQARLRLTASVHADRMIAIVEWALTNGKMNVVYRLGKCAESNLNTALYLIGWNEER